MGSKRWDVGSLPFYESEKSIRDGGAGLRSSGETPLSNDSHGTLRSMALNGLLCREKERYSHLHEIWAVSAEIADADN
jgi:hypothetical protein